MKKSEPAALWVLFRQKPPLEAAGVAAALGEGAGVEGGGGVLSLRVRGHVLRALAAGVPLPKEIVDRCLSAAHLRADQKSELAAHGAHALVVNESEVPGPEGLVALYEAAWALRGDGAAMLGVMNPATWMCLTTDMLAQTLQPDFVQAVLASPAESLALWLGFVKLFKPDGTTWLVTRGGWLVGLPDLAWLALDLAESDEVRVMLAGILDYVHTTGRRLAAGDAIDFGERAVRLRAPYEFVDYIGADTLVIEPRDE